MKTLIIISILLIFCPVYAGEMNSTLSFNYLNKKDGLSNDLIFSIFQDSSGYIWIGTSDGLNRFDGYNFKKFFHDPQDSGSIPHNIVTWICEDSEKNLWVATFGGGISKFDPRKMKFENYNFSEYTDDPDSSKLINHIMCDSKKRLWISTKGSGLILLDNVTGKVKNFKNNPDDQDLINSNKVMSSFEDSNGTIWIATWGEGLWKYIEENGIIERIRSTDESESGPQYKFIHTIIEDAEKNLWLGTRDKGIIKFDRNSGELKSFGMEKTRQVNLTGRNINYIYYDPENDNLIWIGTVTGLYVYKIFEDKFINYTKKDVESGLSNNYIWNIFRDKSGLLWIGTIGGGINVEKRVNRYFGNYNSSEKEGYRLSSNVIGSLYSNKDDPHNLWVGTIGGGLNKIQLKSGIIDSFISNGPAVSSITPRYITCITSDPSSPDVLFIGTNLGLNKYNAKEDIFTKLQSPLEKFIDFNSAYISAFIISGIQGKYLWIGTFGEGLYKLDVRNLNLTNYKFEKEYKNNTDKNRIYTIRQSVSEKEILWLGTNNGLGKYSILSNQFKFFKLPDPGNPKGKLAVLAIYESENDPGIIWLGSKQNGLYRFDSNSKEFTRFTESEGLPDHHIVSIIEEPKGRLWIGTQAGLSSYIIKSGIFRNFDEYEGLRNTVFTLNSLVKNSDNKIYIGGTKGIDFFSPDKLSTNTRRPPIVFTGLKIFGSSDLPGMDNILSDDISKTSEIELPHIYNTITISFAALDYTSPGKNQFACMIEELDKDWKHLGTQNYMTYQGLKPGKYTFKVKGSNSDSVWNENGNTLRIIIKSSFTRTILYKIIIAMIIIILISLILYLWKKLRRISIANGISTDKLMADNGITERELEIIKLILKGKSNKEIEEELYISLGTVKNHLYNIYKKLNIKSRTQLVSLLRSDNRK